jgi:membrane protein YqaA with SNARE-associated domain
MDPHVALVAALAFCLLGGFVPWLNTEAAVAAAALVLPRGALPLLVVGAAAAQVLAKGAVYGLARWAPRGLPPRVQERLRRASDVVAQRRSPLLTVLASASVGVPPFYLTALACGAVAVPMRSFLSAAFAGALVRCALVSGAALLAREGV